ncbi:MAG TPA: phospholipid carrier-dependent glycosyltransferase [Acidimicrobiales bacterium]|nr:phospholipid carrier-dependent glycosyltransferase [Acidimicrobiales bacterium]
MAFGLRLAWVLATSEAPVFVESGDAFSYLYYGRQIAEGGGYLNLDGSGAPTAYYPVGYPGVLGLVFWLVLHTPIPDDLTLAAGLLHVVLGTGSVALVHVLVERTTGSDRTALFAAALLALWPNAIFHTSTVLLETTFTFASLIPLVVLATHRDWRTDPPGAARMAAFGAALGLVALVRPFALPFLALPAALVLVRRHGLAAAARVTAVAALPLVVVLVPWTLRNLDAMGAPLPFSTNMGDTLCIDRNDDAEGGFRWAAHDGCADHRLGEVARNRDNTAKAVRWVLENPDREALQIVRRTRLILGDDHDGLDTVERYGRNPVAGGTGLRRAADGWFFAALALAAVGLARGLLHRSDRRAELLLLVVAPLGTLLTIAALLWGTSRFHVPTHPYLAALAALAVFGTAPAERRGGDTTGPV